MHVHAVRRFSTPVKELLPGPQSLLTLGTLRVRVPSVALIPSECQ